jgi:hypothetical protein
MDIAPGLESKSFGLCAAAEPDGGMMGGGTDGG